MKSLIAGSTYYGQFVTCDTTGAAADATGTPSVTATRNGVDDGDFTLTAAKLDEGRYKITGVVPGYDGGDLVKISVSATVDGIAVKATVDEFLVVVNDLDVTVGATKTAAEAVNTLTKASGDGDLAAMPASVWAAADRTLTGSTLSLGPTASRSRTDGYYKCPQGGTVGFYRRILNWDGEDIQQADIASITYSIFALNADDPLERTEVDGHVDVALEASDVIFDEVQSDEWASDYNFKHIPDISTSGAFAEAGVEYLVEYTITPTSGQKIIERIRVTAN